MFDFLEISGTFGATLLKGHLFGRLVTPGNLVFEAYIRFFNFMEKLSSILETFEFLRI